MRKNHELLLTCLKQQNAPVSSITLGEILHVSSRSIKNYVAEINAQFPSTILSTKQGYYINTLVQAPKHAESVPQTYSERASFIIKEFFVFQMETLDIYDVCDTLYLSYSSVKSLLAKLNKEYEANNIRFQCKNDSIYISGSERDKRRFLTNIINKEASGHLVDIHVLKEMFPSIDVLFINDILHTHLKNDNCYINDFGYINLCLHLTVMLNSILNRPKSTALIGNNLQDNSVANKIVNALQVHFQIPFQTSELEEMLSMISMNIHMCQINSHEDIIKSVGENIFQLTKALIHSINEHYHLHIQEKTLILPLSLHIKNLIERVKHHTSLHNPLLDTIQHSCPILFDCALFAADYLYQHCHIKISNDEIAYIAMHIGSDIERQDENIHKLKCVLLCPDYQKNRSRIFNYLLIHFDSQISIEQCVSFVHEIKETPYDVLFTTTTISPPENISNVIQISLFPSNIDVRDIFNQLEEVFEKRKLAVLHKEFDNFFSSDLFYNAHNSTYNKQEIIHILHDKLFNQGYVDAEFYHDVMKRDEAASTAFGKIAIPHSMKMNAAHTKVALALSHDGILWDQQLVNVVLLIAINEKDSYIFKELYEVLIRFFSQDNIMMLLKDVNDFKAFKDIIYRFTI